MILVDVGVTSVSRVQDLPDKGCIADVKKRNGGWTEQEALEGAFSQLWIKATLLQDMRAIA